MEQIGDGQSTRIFFLKYFFFQLCACRAEEGARPGSFIRMGLGNLPVGVMPRISERSTCGGPWVSGQAVSAGSTTADTALSSKPRPGVSRWQGQAGIPLRSFPDQNKYEVVVRAVGNRAS